MRTDLSVLLVNAAGQLLQQHAFDHFPDEKIARVSGCIHQLGITSCSSRYRTLEHELLCYCREANLYTETATPAALQQWYTVMSGYGSTGTTLVPEEVV